MKLVERVKQAYKNIGLRPCVGTYRKRGACCPVSALVIDINPSMRSMNSRLDSEVASKTIKKSEEWVYGFTKAIDDCTSPTYSREQMAGFRAGRQVKKAIFADADAV